jgi:hypothetical protein
MQDGLVLSTVDTGSPFALSGRAKGRASCLDYGSGLALNRPSDSVLQDSPKPLNSS